LIIALSTPETKNPIPLPTRNGVQSNLRFIPILLARGLEKQKSTGRIGEKGRDVKVEIPDSISVGGQDTLGIFIFREGVYKPTMSALIVKNFYRFLP